MYDGHGSVRQVVLHNETIFAAYSYDAYGNMLGGNPGTPQNPGSPATNLLYAGEQFDTDMQQYYLRARYYDQNTGRFNRMDPFAGNRQDPQSLHKYLYTHGNPINASDPSGMFTLTELMVVIGIVAIATILGVLLGLAGHRLITYIKYRYRDPSQGEEDIVEKLAIPNAKRLVNSVLLTLSYGITRFSIELYTAWFGAYTFSRFQKVKETFTKIKNYLDDGFKWRTFTSYEYEGMYVGSLDLVLFSSPLFYTAPDIPAQFLGDREHNKTHIVIHELAHKAGVGSTQPSEEDWAYGISKSTDLARTAPDIAVDNADNYAYYASGIRP